MYQEMQRYTQNTNKYTKNFALSSMNNNYIYNTQGKIILTYILYSMFRSFLLK